MSDFTVADLKRILQAGDGIDCEVDLESELDPNTSFAEHGFDSLAVLELTNRIEREYGISVEDGGLEYENTPREVVDYVNALLAEARV
ncbi:acyl carrier protein (plasmid) [Streptomyces sp. NBC_00868]|uniref:acyl carrier protein n=1 Tax=unclassified Streptomyces TaxID=2593676 RepID=UPI002F90B400|nr:acyl carrier protein [Streptomyces sp. NBC_00868]